MHVHIYTAHVLGRGLVLLETEPLVELGGVIEDVRQEKVEHRPQLVQVVLQRSARDEKPEVGREEAHHLMHT